MNNLILFLARLIVFNVFIFSIVNLRELNGESKLYKVARLSIVTVVLLGLFA